MFDADDGLIFGGGIDEHFYGSEAIEWVMEQDIAAGYGREDLFGIRMFFAGERGVVFEFEIIAGDGGEFPSEVHAELPIDNENIGVIEAEFFLEEESPFAGHGFIDFEQDGIA